MEVTNLRNHTASSVSRCFGRTENPFFSEVLDTQEAKKKAYELILQQALEVSPVITALNFISDSASTAAFKDWVVSHLYQDIAIGCYTYPQRELVAVDFLHCRQISTTSTLPACKFTGELFYNFIKYLNIIHDHVRANCQQMDQNSWYLTSLGVFTKPAYKYQNIQKEMINMRKHVAIALRIQVFASAFIGKEMQEVAKKLKYKVFNVFNQEEMALLGLDVTHEEVFPIKIMGFIKTRAPAYEYACVLFETY